MGAQHAGRQGAVDLHRERQAVAGGQRRVPRWFGELGTGLVDWPALMAALRETGYAGWLVVESDKGPAPIASGVHSFDHDSTGRYVVWQESRRELTARPFHVEDDAGVVRVDKFAPVTVAERCATRSGADDVSAKDR